jgi:hypothetical protein
MEDAEVAETRKFYASSNGDQWFLVRDANSERVFVRHQPNTPSGGQIADLDIGDFLARGGHSPEHQALLHLVGTLVGDDSDR